MNNPIESTKPPPNKVTCARRTFSMFTAMGGIFHILKEGTTIFTLTTKEDTAQEGLTTYKLNMKYRGFNVKIYICLFSTYLRLLVIIIQQFSKTSSDINTPCCSEITRASKMHKTLLAKNLVSINQSCLMSVSFNCYAPYSECIKFTCYPEPSCIR